MKRSSVPVGRKVTLLMAALPVMLIALGGVGMAGEGVTDGWLHSRIANEPRQTSSSVATDGWYHSEIGEQASTFARLPAGITRSSAAAPAQRATTDGWLASTVGESARAESAGRVAAAGKLAGSTDGWLHSVVGDAARDQQPIRVVDSPVQTHLPDMTLIVLLISTGLLAATGGFFLRSRFAH